ncbi:head-tail adaptor protein, partial [Salipiger bermudensis]
MSIPLLNRRLVLEAPVVSPDGAGGQMESWTAMGTLWAEIRPKTGREATGEAGAMSVRAF